jgi:hypothetical protein
VAASPRGDGQAPRYTRAAFVIRSAAFVIPSAAEESIQTATSRILVLKSSFVPASKIVVENGGGDGYNLKQRVSQSILD